MYIYIHICFNHQNLSCPIPNLSFSRICPTPLPQGPVCLKRARCVTRMPCSIWPTPWMPRCQRRGEDVWLGPLQRCPPLLDGQAMNAEDALVDLRYCTLAVFLLILMMVCGIKMWRDFLLTKSQLKITCTCSCWWLLCFFFPVFCWKNSETGDLWGRLHETFAQWKKRPGCLGCIGEYISLCHRVEIISYYRNPWLNSRYNGKYSVFFFQGILLNLACFVHIIPTWYPIHIHTNQIRRLGAFLNIENQW